MTLVIADLGSIIAGIAAPTEAGSMGAFGRFLLALSSARLNWSVMREVVRASRTASAMVYVILICAQPFGLAFLELGGEGLVESLSAGISGGIEG